ncbi:hypothetical protein PYCCODRAFT_256220 [Trametes coccinea BRFM310]|uniref:Integrase catalytic domain-containing protein n=1 Tax=Trametes coccinea (strain BRFM310) TaxID=1353009 RepID=A0A1Y2IQ79_TRAC3|nr:hypothetical protein PYCCODRAFT_256220 [Trametes coccinea BRFM310]
MVNPAGINGHNNGRVPTDEELKAALVQYAREGLTQERRLARLRLELGYNIGKTKLKELQAKFNIARVRKPPALPTATTLICEKMAEDLHRRRGPNIVKSLLAVEGHQIPRSVVRAAMRDNDPLGPALRHPRSSKNQIVRKVLTCKGSHHELSVDGHEKLGPAALAMGGVGFHIYAGRDKNGGAAVEGRVVPNARQSAVVCHIYLDYVGVGGVMPRQVTFDGGSETQDLKAAHMVLRNACAPDLDVSLWPPFMALKSTHNISIENLWSRWLKYAGWNLQATLLQGKSNGLFNSANHVDFNLFQWLWSQVAQKKFDEFRQVWNCHRIRGQKGKEMPSGGTPWDIFVDPGAYGGEDLGIKVDREIVERLRAELPISREDEAAECAHTVIGSPALTIENGWVVFAGMKQILCRMYLQ